MGIALALAMRKKAAKNEKDMTKIYYIGVEQDRPSSKPVEESDTDKNLSVENQLNQPANEKEESEEEKPMDANAVIEDNGMIIELNEPRSYCRQKQLDEVHTN